MTISIRNEATTGATGSRRLVERGWTAAAAYRRFGPGASSGARLKVGDCFACALASLTGEPPLFTGDDVAATDVRSALGAG